MSHSYNKNDTSHNILLKKVEIMANYIRTIDDYEQMFHDQNFRKSKLQKGDIINVYSRTFKQWITNAHIIDKYQKGDKVFVNIEYQYGDITGYKQLEIISKYIDLPFKIHPNLIIISVKNDNVGSKVQQRLVELGITRGVIYYSPDQQAMIQRKIIQNEAYIMILAHYVTWKVNPLARFMQRRVDIVFKFDFGMTKFVYKDYEQMLNKQRGQLIKFPLYIKYKRLSYKYIQYMLLISDEFVTTSIFNHWTHCFEYVLPSDIIKLTSLYMHDDFVEISNYKTLFQQYNVDYDRKC